MIVFAEKNGIALEYWNFEPPVEAIYYVAPGVRPTIGLSQKLLNNRAHYRTVFAEELGHHFTTARQNMLKICFHHADRIAYSKEEHKARKWAASYLMSDSDIKKAIKKGLIETWQLSDYFSVDEEMIILRLRLFEKMRGK